MFDYCINFKIRTLSRILTATYNRAYAEEKVTISQAGMLMYVFMEPGIKMKDFAERHHINKSSLSLEVKLMVQSGWLAPDAKTGLQLSDEGYLKAKRVHKIWKRVNVFVAEQLGEEAVEGLIVHDLNDATVPYADAMAYADHWPQARLVTTRSQGHRRNGDGVPETIVDFLQSREVSYSSFGATK